jgi:hypothetical protein
MNNTFSGQTFNFIIKFIDSSMGEEILELKNNITTYTEFTRMEISNIKIEIKRDESDDV